MFLSPGRCQGNVPVSKVRGSDRDGLNVLIIKQLLIISVIGLSAVLVCGGLSPFGNDVADRNEFGAWEPTVDLGVTTRLPKIDSLLRD